MTAPSSPAVAYKHKRHIDKSRLCSAQLSKDYLWGLYIQYTKDCTGIVFSQFIRIGEQQLWGRRLNGLIFLQQLTYTLHKNQFFKSYLINVNTVK